MEVQALETPDPRRYTALWVALTAPFLGVVDFFIATLALPAIQRDLGATRAQQELVIALYALGMAVFVVTGGRLGDTHGRRRMFLLGMALFVVTSVLCGLAPTALTLVIGRLLQGFSAGLLFPQVLSIVQVSFPENERARALSYFGLVVGVASVVGLMLGGALMQLDLGIASWRLLFLINLPIGGVALWLAARTLREVRAPSPPKLDLGGVVLATLALSLLLVPLVEGQEQGWPAWCFYALAASVPAFVAFVLHERSATRAGRDPLIDLGLFELVTFRNGLFVVTAYFGGFASLFLVLSLFMQHTASETSHLLDQQIVATSTQVASGVGVAHGNLEEGAQGAIKGFGPYAVTLFLASLLASRHAQARAAQFLAGGLGLVCAGLVAIVIDLGTGPPGESGFGLYLGMALFGFGHGCVSPVLYSTILRGVPARSAGAASGVLSTTQQVASSLGVAAIGLVFFGALGDDTSRASYAHAAALAVSCNLAALVVASFFALRLMRKARASVEGPRA